MAAPQPQEKPLVRTNTSRRRFLTLIRIGYSRVVAFEHEKNAEDPLPGLAESVGYVRGVLAAMA